MTFGWEAQCFRTHQTFWQQWQWYLLGDDISEMTLDHKSSCFYGLWTLDPICTSTAGVKQDHLLSKLLCNICDRMAINFRSPKAIGSRGTKKCTSVE